MKISNYFVVCFALSIVTLLTSISKATTDPFEIYKNEVHSITQVRCGICHGQSQNPLHSVADARAAYPVAKTLVSFNDPESSRLWIRSQNGHCGIPSRCGIIDPKLLEGIKNWVNAEKLVQTTLSSAQDSTQTNSNSSTSGAEAPAKIEGKRAFTNWVEFDGSVKENEIKQISFYGPTGEKYKLSYTLKPGGIFYFYRPEFALVPRDIAFSGLVLESPDLDFRSQNFEESAYILRATKSAVVLTTQGYVMAVKPESKNKFTVRLILTDYENKISLQEIIDLRTVGYLRPKSQALDSIPIEQVVAGSDHTCALFENKSVKCWGDNQYGQLGLGDNPELRHRKNVGNELFDLKKLKPLFPNQKIIQLALGGSHTCALFEDRSIKCWGNNDKYGSLGLGENPELRKRAIVGNEPGDLMKLKPLFPGQKATQIVAGYSHTCALFEDHSVKCWGFNRYAQLGLGDNPELRQRDNIGNEPGDLKKLKSLFPNRKVTQLSAGSSQTCVLFSDKTFLCWGVNGKYYSVGGGDIPELRLRENIGNEPGDLNKLMPLLPNQVAIQVTIGGQHICALFEDKSIKCWGGNSSYELGLGDNPDLKDRYNVGNEQGDLAKLKSLFPDRKVENLASGNGAICALFDDKTIRCWGYRGGLLGSGDNPEFKDRTAVGYGQGDLAKLKSLFPNQNVMQVTVGNRHACALFEDHSLKCWGSNNHAQLGLENGAELFDRDELGDDPGELKQLDPLLFNEVP